MSGMCPSCMEDKPLQHEWYPDVPRPDGIVGDLICSDCYGSLKRFAGDDEHPLDGVAAPHPASEEAMNGLLRMTRL